MKKNLLSLFLMFLALGFITSCDNDSDDKFITMFEKETLKLNYNKIPITDKNVFVSANGNTVTLQLNGIIAGIPEFTISNATITKADAKQIIKGEAIEGSRKITVSGEIKNNVLSLDVTTLNLSSLKGKLNLVQYKDNGDPWETIMLDSPFLLDCESKTGKVMFSGNEMTDDQFETSFRGFFGQILGPMLRDISLSEDGFLIASYKSSFSQQEYLVSPRGAMSFYVKDEKLYLVPHMAAMTTRSTDDIFQQMMIFGLPLNIKKIDDKTISFTITRDMMLPFMDIISGLVASIPDNQFPAGMAPIIKNMVTELNMIVAESKKFDLGFKFVVPAK